jgi:hypothetical protein
MHTNANQRDESVSAGPGTRTAAEKPRSPREACIPEAAWAEPDGRVASAAAGQLDQDHQAEQRGCPPAPSQTEAINLALREHRENSDGWSNLRLYECWCGVKVRVGRARFNAQCLDCGGVFVLKEALAQS